MIANLNALQARLEVHFATLASARKDRSLAVFAFEHGLDSDELSKLPGFLKAALGTGGYQLSKHWLVWIVYATEQGYDYDGDEYWHTFERRMPMWDRGWRPSLRAWFGKFHKTYCGLLPMGRWANFFSIIAWPITHALLPKDLQGQLARALYGLRYQLVSRLDQSPLEVGRYVARMTRGGSSRFDNFLEQEELVGRIVLGLLDQRTAEADGAILPQALARIVRDLEKARNARQWLHDTRKAVEVARMRGAARPAHADASVVRRADATPQLRRPTIRPALSLRRTGADEWTPVVELPSFHAVADLSPELGEFLKRTRCSVAGSPGVRPPGWLLNGSQMRVLDTWPPADAPVLSFATANAAMDHLLSSEGRISSGPYWLFRTGSDGRAVEVLGRLVRPGQSYVLVARADLPSLSTASPTRILCKGAAAIRIEIPAALTVAHAEELKKAGLSVAQTIRVWPVGLAARGWDGEGATEWLETECPCFAIQHDHPVAEYELRLGAGPALKVAAQAIGIPTFVRLQPMPAGNHVLSISVAKDAAADAAGTPVEGVISLAVRPPAPWVSGSIGHSGLIATSEPAEPTLDEFWEGLAQVSVLGPAGRQVTVCVELLDGSGGRIAVEQVGQLTLPLGQGAWRTAFETFERREKEPWGYLGASSGRILVDGEELGTVLIPLHRDVSPVRWIWRATNKTTLLRLIDDHDGDAPVRVSFHSFAKPLEEEHLDAEAIGTGVEPLAPGGLFVARFGDHRVSLVVGMRKVDGFGGLLVEPHFARVPRSKELALAIVHAIFSWSDARVAGALATERRARVVARLKEHFFEVMCGPNWANAERGLRMGLPVEAAVEALLQCFEKKRVFALVLARDAGKFARLADHVRQREFASLAHRYSVAPGVASKPALDLLAVLDGESRPAEAELIAIIDHLWDHQALTAGARIIQLLGRADVGHQGTTGGST
ncbi:hypothetical protein C8J44_3643 [Sphingomonas sp. PP-CE-3A-406]|nr:hypothetical protein C8J44_3643 [Sphingomonas sp. PP-CE-3A-406]